MNLSPDMEALQIIGPFWLCAAGIIGYLLGSIPFGLLLARAAGLGDVRKIGSGNMGATNVLRTGSRKIAALTLLCDMAKGALATAVFSLIAFNLGAFAGFCAFIGHLYPVWLKFKGGKGVATYLGVLLALSWLCAVIFAAIWLAVAWLSRYSSLAALTAAFITPFFAAFWLPFGAAALLALMSALIFLRHRGNIARLRAGTESKIKSRAAQQS